MIDLIKLEDVLRWDPCEDYDEEHLAELIGEGITPLELTDMELFEGVDFRDRLWVLLRIEVLGAKTCRLFGCWCARQALALIKDPDPRSVTAIEVAERFAVGEATRSDLAAAADGSWAAAAAAAAAADGSWAAAAAAAADAAADAARAADADADAAADAARAAQMSHLETMIKAETA